MMWNFVTIEAASSEVYSESGWVVSSGKIFTDTRTICPGDVFVAIRGKNFDGNYFVH
ncbi:MAG: hypothetical protein ACTJLK_04760 [Anaplasma sp.]